VLKNTYQLGLSAEAVVINFYEKTGYKLIKQRWRSPFAEVDLMLQGSRNNEILLVEVKKSSFSDFRAHVITRKQKNRLSRVVMWLSERGYQVSLNLVVVNEFNEIEEYKDVFG
jgi:Holliday junction resolvase-like predicted endonuclease